MSSVSDFKVGDGIRWRSKSSKLEDYQYGLVIGTDDRNLQVIPVLELDAHTKCYDEGGADPKTDRDNVRLKHCTSEHGPFSELCELSERGGCYVYAVPSKVLSVGNLFIRLNHMEVDGDEPTHKDDVKDVIDHLWRDERQVGSVPVVQNDGGAASRRVPGDRRHSDAVQEPGEGEVAVDPFGQRRQRRSMAAQLEEAGRRRARLRAGPEQAPRAEPAADGRTIEERLDTLSRTGVRPPDTGHGGLGS